MRVAFSPHSSSNALLKTIADDIGKNTTSSLFFSLAFLYQTPGPVLDAIKKVSASEKVFVYGISDRKVGGLDLRKPDGNVTPVFPAALTRECSGAVLQGARWRWRHPHASQIRRHRLRQADRRVYLGSYNFSSPADIENGENLLLIRDRRIAVPYVIEALRIFDHYHFKEWLSRKPRRLKET